tara:strand:- start:345 stop:659 length:315 start_codon:yes stop_codon:yes gene_type:complete
MPDDYKCKFETYAVGSLCVPAPFFQDNWMGYWIIIEIMYDDVCDDLFVSMYGLNIGRSLILPYSELEYYFTCISGEKTADVPAIMSMNERERERVIKALKSRGE